MTGSAVGKRGKIAKWGSQNLIKRGDLVDILIQHLKIAKHPPPEGMYGDLYCIDGIAEAAIDIMNYLETRAVELKKMEDKKNG